MDTVLKWMGEVDADTYEPPAGIPEPGGEHDLVLYKTDFCPFCIRVMRVLDAVDVDVKMRDVSGDPEARAHLLEVTGRRTVPCMFIDGVPMFESADISDWLRVHAERNAA
ncbi:glutaredoxin family protein [Persicimonas caeni]|nr:glutaredoxin [Persicimonas caeni]